MKRVWFALVLPVVVGVSPRASAQSRAPRDEAVVVARVEAVQEAPLCGVLFVSPVARHAVVRVERGSVGAGPLFAFYRCGMFDERTHVAPGVTMRLHLTRRPHGAYGMARDGLEPAAAPRWYVARAEAL